jgi:sensor histidine kinase regulating citrate/malate metabolism
VVASLEEGIVVSDDQGIITAANRAAESILERRLMVGERLDTCSARSCGPATPTAS